MLVALQFHKEVMQHFLLFARVLEVFVETLQGNAYDIAMVKLRTRTSPA